MTNLSIKLKEYLDNKKFDYYLGLLEEEKNIINNDDTLSKSLKSLKIELLEIQAFNILDNYYDDIDLNKILIIKDINKRQKFIRRILTNCDDKNTIKGIIMEIILSK